MDIHTLTNDEINRLIHKNVMEEPCWHEFTSNRDYSEWDICLNCKVRFEHGCSNPNYCTNLNATQLAKNKMLENISDPDMYVEYLADITGMRWIVFATARQQSEAVLMACGLGD